MRKSNTLRKILYVGIAVFFAALPFMHPNKLFAAQNLITNPTLAAARLTQANIPLSWEKNSYGRNTPVFTYPVPGQDDNYAAKIDVTNYLGGDAKWYFDPVPVDPAATYTFSNWYISTGSSQLIIRYTLDTGAFSYSTIVTLPTSSVWKQAQITFTPPQNAKAVTVFHALKDNGSLTVDNYALTSSLASTDAQAPVVSLTAPAANATLSAMTTVSADATDNVGVSKVKFFIDGVAIGEDVSSPYAISLDTTKYTNGTHNFTAQAEDAAGNSATSAAVTVTVNNTVTPPPPPPPTSDNLIVNPSLETASALSPNIPQGWNQGKFGISQAVFSYPVTGYDGSRAAQITMSNRVNGDAKWFFDPVAVTGGGHYVFSDYAKATVQTSLVAQYTLSDGTFLYSNLITVPPSDSWKQTTVMLTTPASATKMTVFHLIRANGTLSVDNYSLTDETTDPTKFKTGMVTLAFDDGFKVTYDNALPILNNAHIVSTQNIITGSFGDPEYVNQDEVLAMQAQGHEIAAHTKTHRDLTTLTEAEMRDEVTGSRTDLLNIGATPVETFVYPYGETNDQIRQVVQESGFIGARGVNLGFNDKTSDPYYLLDEHVEETTTVDQVKSWIDTALNTKTWLIMELHRTMYGGGQYSNTPETLQGIVNYLVAKHAPVVTMQKGLEAMGF